MIGITSILSAEMLR